MGSKCFKSYRKPILAHFSNNNNRTLVITQTIKTQISLKPREKTPNSQLITILDRKYPNLELAVIRSIEISLV